MVSIRQRVKQLGWAISAHYRTINQQLLAEELTEEEQKLFFAMSKVDQYHAYRVYQDAIQLWKQQYDRATQAADSYEYRMLKKTALLHDIGRKKGEFSIIDKVVAVIFDKIIETKTRHKRQQIINRIIAKQQPRFLYIYYFHPVLSREKLQNIGCDPLLLYLTENHHAEGFSNTTIENYEIHTLLRILKKADALN